MVFLIFKLMMDKCRRKLVDLSLLLPTDHVKNLQAYLSWEANEKEGKKSPFLKEKKRFFLLEWKPENH